jgi:tRNA-splicing ligase RtcB (3'-phosphate/5'-hydroxy nucleic acid ligase)
MSGEFATLKTWIAHPLSTEVAQSIDRLRGSDDVLHVAIMPDVHLSQEVCVGAVVATSQLLYPQAVGGDIGCGMLALGFDAEATAIDNERDAAKILAALYERVPSNKHRQPRDLPASLVSSRLTSPQLEKLATRDGRVQLGTLGRGNHFLEFQADQEDRLWIMVHSGSRAIGQAIAAFHLKCALRSNFGLLHLYASEDAGVNYLADMQWSRSYAAENRLAMAMAVVEILREGFNIAANWNTLIHCDHNHVQQELHGGRILWVHRKGAQSATIGEPGIIPGSMGTASFHVAGRGCTDALTSCSHGAGRALSRTDARQHVGRNDFERQLGNVWYDHRKVESLRDEAPAAYKDIRQVMKAQRELVRIEREQRPVLNYKGT